MHQAIKNITLHPECKGIIISVYQEDSSWKVSYEEDYDKGIKLDSPIKWMCERNGVKQVVKSFSEREVTKDLIDKVEEVISLFEKADKDSSVLYL